VDDIGRVEHTVDYSNRRVVNTTVPGEHLLDPGTVTRSVFSSGGSIVVRTVGFGTGPYPKINEKSANALWKATDAQIVFKQTTKLAGQNLNYCAAYPQ
jgi:hypothetical protein